MDGDMRRIRVRLLYTTKDSVEWKGGSAAQGMCFHQVDWLARLDSRHLARFRGDALPFD